MGRMIALALGVLAAWPAMAQSSLSNEDSSGVVQWVQWCDPTHPRLPFCVTAKPQQSITAPDPPPGASVPNMCWQGSVMMDCRTWLPIGQVPPPLTIGAQPGGHTSQWITDPPTTTITVPAGSVATFPGGQLTGPVTIEIRPAK